MIKFFKSLLNVKNKVMPITINFDIDDIMSVIKNDNENIITINLEDEGYLDFMDQVVKKFPKAYLNGYCLQELVKQYLTKEHATLRDEITFDSEASQFVSILSKAENLLNTYVNILRELFKGETLENFLESEYSNINWNI